MNETAKQLVALLSEERRNMSGVRDMLKALMAWKSSLPQHLVKAGRIEQAIEHDFRHRAFGTDSGLILLYRIQSRPYGAY